MFRGMFYNYFKNKDDIVYIVVMFLNLIIEVMVMWVVFFEEKVVDRIVFVLVIYLDFVV